MVENHKDIIWNYAATLLKIASSVLLLPLILKMMPTEMVGIWSIFVTITSLVTLFDFGFTISFTRNVTYVFSGVSELKKSGYNLVDSNVGDINFSLLKGLIESMRWFYKRLAFFVFFLLITGGTFYIRHIVNNYTGDHLEIYLSWIILCLISAYNLYTLYYESLLLGKALIKRSKQIIIIGQSIYLVIAASLILYGFGLISIVSAQVFSVLIIRILSYKSFFNKEIVTKLKSVESVSRNEIIPIIYPNAFKIGLTGLGGFLVTRSAIIIGSFYLSLTEIAQYGITWQIISVLSGLASVYISTFQPYIANYRVSDKVFMIKELYVKGVFYLIMSYVFFGLLIMYIVPYFLNIIRSNTELMPIGISLCLLIVSFLETNHSIAGNILLTKNEVPFFKASIISGLSTIVLLYILLKFTNLGLLSMILAPGIVQIVYQNWKWPVEVIKDLNLTLADLKNMFKY